MRFLLRCTGVFKLLFRCSSGSSAACDHVWQACLAAVPLVLWLVSGCIPAPLLMCVCGVGPGCNLERDYGMCLPFNHLLCRLARTSATASRVLVRGCHPCGVEHLFIYLVQNVRQVKTVLMVLANSEILVATQIFIFT